MKVGIIQSNYIPWRGYFDFINSVDLFIIYDDVKYTKGDWRNRNKIKTPQGLDWLTVPVHYKHLKQLINETTIDYTHYWQHNHIKKFSYHYQKAPFCQEILDLFESAILNNFAYLSQLNFSILELINHYLDIKTPLIHSQDYKITGTKTARLINLLEQVGATSYLSGPAAKSYLDETLFQKAGIGLEYKTYDYLPYPQLWGDFQGNVSILDLLANTGKDAKNYLITQTPNKVIF
ncbi:MAG: WbqC family protein [Crocosphaera sp.]|nr:WbqC family protein [Crocosphaera sp.]